MVTPISAYRGGNRAIGAVLFLAPCLCVGIAGLLSSDGTGAAAAPVPATAPELTALVVRLDPFGNAFFPSSPTRPIRAKELDAQLAKEIVATGKSARDVELRIWPSENTQWSTVYSFAQSGRAAGISKTMLRFPFIESTIELLPAAQGKGPAGEKDVVVAIRRNPEFLVVDPTNGQPKLDQEGHPVYRRPVGAGVEVFVTLSSGKAGPKEVALKGKSDDDFPLRSNLKTMVQRDALKSVTLEAAGPDPIRILEPIFTELLAAGLTGCAPRAR